VDQKGDPAQRPLRLQQSLVDPVEREAHLLRRDDAAGAADPRGCAQDRAVAAARSAFDKSVKRHSAGLVSFLDVVDSERTLLDAQRKANAIRSESLAISVALIKAIGGKW